MPDTAQRHVSDSPTSVHELQSHIADASASRTPLRIVGSGTWLEAGHPVASTRGLCTRGISGVVEYVPGDLVITVRAGTTLGEIADITGEQGQWLALDPYASPEALRTATIGATIATASSGPLALGFGRARDLVLGLSFVSGDGTAVRAGGRVVKNVAGFDLVRLTTGAWGTLGVITELSLRLHARPAVDETVAVTIEWPDSPTARAAALAALALQLNTAPARAVATALVALVILDDGAVQTLAGSLPATSHEAGTAVLLARATGNRTRVNAMRDALSAFGKVISVDQRIWDAVRTLDVGNTTLRTTDAPSRLGESWSRANAFLRSQTARDIRMVIDPLRGVVRSSATCDTTDARWQLPAATIAERLPESAWRVQPSPVIDEISQRLRASLDPAGILNTGIFGATTSSAAESSAAMRS